MTTRRKRKGAKAMPLVVQTSDLGPRSQHENGKLVVDREATDPDRPNGTYIHRAMRHPNYVRMQKKGDITELQREACDAYAVLTEWRDGARWVNGQRVGGRSCAAYRGHPTMTQVQASARLTRAHAALGGDASALMVLFVAEDLPMGELARRRQEREEVTKGMVIAAIRRLAELWGMVPDEPKKSCLTKPQNSRHV